MWHLCDVAAALEIPLRGPKGEPVDFARTIVSHVAELPPNHIDLAGRTLGTTLLARTGAHTVLITERGEKLRIEGNTDPKLTKTVAHMFRLDEDFTGFYELVRDDELAWCATGAGRMLRAPTVFEDVVKTICTFIRLFAQRREPTAGSRLSRGSISRPRRPARECPRDRGATGPDIELFEDVLDVLPDRVPRDEEDRGDLPRRLPVCDPAQNLGFTSRQRRALSVARSCGCVHLDQRRPKELEEGTVALAEAPPAAFEIDHACSADRRRQPDAQAVVDTERFPDRGVPLRVSPL
jgi:hypothetical protein